MRIHLYLRHFPADGTEPRDGMAKAVHGLAWGLSCCGARVTVLCEGRQATGRAPSPGGYEVWCFPEKRRPWGRCTSEELAQAVHGGLGADLVVLNGIFNRDCFRLARILDSAGTAYVAAPHDPYHPEIFRPRRSVKWAYWHLRERWLLHKAAAIQLLDARHEQYLRELGIDRPVAAAPNGYDPADVPAESCLQWSSSGPVRLLFLGRLDLHNKGLDLLIEAVAPMAEMTLTIQGPDWGDRGRLEKMIRCTSQEEQVRLRQPDYQHRPADIIAGHDIFCLPSRFEGFGLAAMEAMLAGRVVLVSEVCGLAPHVRACDCGVVVRPEARTIRAGLLELVDRRRQWQEMGLRGRHHVLSQLRWDQIAAHLLSQYRELGLLGPSRDTT